uniref:Uncharacterized protein n=1 Tax=Prevotella sp. GTC17253 TaxID=3236793 RepID=A0AB33IQU5_9BACT
MPFTDATNILFVGHAVLDHWAGNEILEFVLVPLVESFELVVDVHDKILPDIGECVLLLRIYLARIAVTVQGRRTEQIQKRGLELSLLACQHEAGMVTAVTVVHCVGDYCHEPLGEVRQPFVGVAYGYATCQSGNGFQ